MGVLGLLAFAFALPAGLDQLQIPHDWGLVSQGSSLTTQAHTTISAPAYGSNVARYPSSARNSTMVKPKRLTLPRSCRTFLSRDARASARA